MSGLFLSNSDGSSEMQPDRWSGFSGGYVTTDSGQDHTGVQGGGAQVYLASMNGTPVFETRLARQC
jgi:hypothetical protein